MSHSLRAATRTAAGSGVAEPREQERPLQPTRPCLLTLLGMTRDDVGVASSPPTPSLPTALSQALIAFTIEFDNEFEHRVEHHTGNRKGRGVWLTSMVMWSNFMR